ncbi:MAG: lipase [Isosphaera sp.]|nr:lipase [Isosphaera sp.]
MTRVLLPAAVLALAAPTAALAQPKLPDGTAEHRDLRYGPHQERNTLDLFVPKSAAPVPLVIWVHGGAWSAGSKSGNNPAMPLLAKGYAVASINYRLSQHDVFPAQIEDCKAAVRLLRANAKKYNLNPDAFGAWGSSAGGHLVALLGTAGEVKELEGKVGDHAGVSSKVQCVVDFYGPTELATMGKQSGPNSKIDHDDPKSPESRLIGGPIKENKAKADKASPLTHASKGSPPFLFLHGDADPLVPLAQSESLHAALKKLGVESELVVLKGAGHGGAAFGSPESRDTITAFLDKHLKGKK